MSLSPTKIFPLLKKKLFTLLHEFTLIDAIYFLRIPLPLLFVLSQMVIKIYVKNSKT
jgi:hypothetical protein